MNKAQIETEAILRTVITYEDSYQKVHFIIYQERFTEDRLYLINEYPEYIKTEYDNIIKQAD